MLDDVLPFRDADEIRHNRKVKNVEEEMKHAQIGSNIGRDDEEFKDKLSDKNTMRIHKEANKKAAFVV